ncbi:LLM class F420-dependent oxidoreductase [Streptosporangium sandarakinum]|uniref:LLM class F420-dependent oxidoreductase n=1 Tax=Streptosporangium TaxID=2000 RepID=UPI0031F932E5
MKLRIFTEPQQGSTYEELLTVARTAERLGFDAFFRSDHYLRISEGDPGPGSSDAWVTLAGLARDTSTIRLGTLVSPATFRLPGPLAISVAQVDQMSGGRVELGLGTGWFDAEHTAYGIPFPPVGERFSRFEEQLEIVTGLWSTPPGETFSFEGAHYRLADSPALPKPVQSPRPPIIIGGFGATRTPRLAARFADEYNLPFHDLGDTELAFDRVRKACEAAGRDAIVLSAAQTVAVGADEAEVARRAQAAGHDLAALRANGLAGTPAEVAEKIGRFAELGAEHLYLQVMDLSDLDHLELIAAEVLPHV